MDTTKTVADVINPFLNELKRRAKVNTFYETALEWVEENENKLVKDFGFDIQNYIRTITEELKKPYR